MTGMTDDDVPAVRQVASRVVYENRWLTLTEDDVERLDGSVAIYGVVHKRDYVVVIPVEGDRVHLVEQYRYPVGGRYWEFPQGAVDDAAATTPEQVAAIELAEETGLRADTLTVIGRLHDAYGYSTQHFHVLVANGLTQGPASREPEEQDMRSAWFTLDEMWAMIADGRMTDSASVAALALFERDRRQPGMSTSTRPSGPAS